MIIHYDTNLVIIICSVNIASNEGFLKTGEWPLLTVMSAGHALHVFINGKLAGDLKLLFSI